MKRILFLLFFVLICLGLGQAASAQTFTDVQDHWAKGYIDQLFEAKVISGYPDGAFRPDGHITRAEFIKALVSSSEQRLPPKTCCQPYLHRCKTGTLALSLH